MITIPKKVADRLIKEVGKFQKILRNAKDRDVNESDTVTIITDMLSDVFGFDKYTEITAECSIKGTYCDLAIKIEGNIKLLIEIKAIGLELKDNHLRQAINYGANKGIQWVVLSNGVDWEVHKIRFEGQIETDRVCAFNFLDINPKRKADQEKLYILCRRGISTDAIEVFNKRAQSVNRFVIGALLLSEPVIGSVRKELRKIAPSIKVANDEIERILKSEVIKREVAEGEMAEKARTRTRKAIGRKPRKKDTIKAEKSKDMAAVVKDSIINSAVSDGTKENEDS